VKDISGKGLSAEPEKGVSRKFFDDFARKIPQTHANLLS
jgi:hypothetical protein